MYSGDIGHVDEEGFLFISDRAKEIIIRGGENISSIAVENAFYVDSRIKDAAVVPVKDDAMGELVAYVFRLEYSDSKLTRFSSSSSAL